MRQKVFLNEISLFSLSTLQHLSLPKRSLAAEPLNSISRIPYKRRGQRLVPDQHKKIIRRKFPGVSSVTCPRTCRVSYEVFPQQFILRLETLTWAFSRFRERYCLRPWLCFLGSIVENNRKKVQNKNSLDVALSSFELVCSSLHGTWV